jgi:hypothetical protein
MALVPSDMFEDMAVVDVTPGQVETHGDGDDVARVDADDVFPAMDLGGLEGPRRGGRIG